MSGPLSPSFEPTPGPVDCRPGRGGGFGWLALAFLGVAIAFGVFVLLLHPGASVGAGPWVFWPFFPFGLFFLVLLFFGLGRWAWWGYGPGGRAYRTEPPGAFSILAVRYARGEIGRDQYLEMLRVLEQRGGAGPPRG